VPKIEDEAVTQVLMEVPVTAVFNAMANALWLLLQPPTQGSVEDRLASLDQQFGEVYDLSELLRVRTGIEAFEFPDPTNGNDVEGTIDEFGKWLLARHDDLDTWLLANGETSDNLKAHEHDAKDTLQ
jgi:hypothetical protein